MGGPGSDVPAHLEAVETGHHPIQQSQARTVGGLQMRPCFVSVARDEGFVAPFQDRPAENSLKSQVIFRDKNSRSEPPSPSLVLLSDECIPFFNLARKLALSLRSGRSCGDVPCYTLCVPRP